MKTISQIITEDSATMNLNEIIDNLNAIIRYEYETTINMLPSAKKAKTAFEIADKIINYFGYKNLEKIFTKHFDVEIEENRTYIRTDIKDRILMNITFS